MVTHEKFKSFVKNEWLKISVKGRGDFILYEKLELLKHKINEWNREVFGWINLKVSKEVENLCSFDNKLIDNFGENTDVVLKDRNNVTGELWNLLNLKESMLRLKSRQLWLKDGDKNTQFFYNSLKERYRGNTISSLEGVNDIMEPLPEGLNLNSLNDDDCNWLERPFSEEEIKEAVWSCDGNKSAGPDGYSTEFFKQNWELLKGDVFKLVEDFHNKARLTKACTSSFRTLVPKNKCPQSLSEYRHICLVRSLYKVLSKILASRLRSILGKLVSDSLPFKFLGVKIGDNPRKLSIWRDPVDSLRKRLTAWKGRHLSLVGRVTLIKSVLNATPVYTLSFYKAHSKVIREICSIKSNFLWGGGGDKKQVYWVSWELVFSSREIGGLSVKNVEVMNLALLNKWKWQILKEQNLAWSSLLKGLYANTVIKVLIGNESALTTKNSIWLKDLILSDDNTIPSSKSFAGAVSCRIGNGKGTSFWYSRSNGQQPLKEAFSELLTLAANPSLSVVDAGAWKDRGWCWNSPVLFETGDVQDHDLQQYFEEVVHDFMSAEDLEDSYEWLKEPLAVFTTKSCFHHFNKPLSFPSINPSVLMAIDYLWKIKVPPKIQLFGWRFLINRLPTKNQLFKRGIFPNVKDLCCVFCSTDEETLSHFCSSCSITREV
ncbi:uncharacterized protein LOC131623866 [Vicia villosa]|uniref:uncharacterized protein LOC131623866 n=1 Tax=Vicia villosa TaxID=3911 RepID=UPI00273BC93C|nr:uncharacterized protein LOC131623866 [Vicia villosa]